MGGGAFFTTFQRNSFILKCKQCRSGPVKLQNISFVSIIIIRSVERILVYFLLTMDALSLIN